MPVDTLYAEYSEMYPDLFPNQLLIPDQLQKIIDVAQSLKPNTKTIGEAMSENDIWAGPVTEVLDAIHGYRSTVKEKVVSAKKSEKPVAYKPKDLPKKKVEKPDMYAQAKGQKEAPKTIKPSEQVKKDLPKL